MRRTYDQYCTVAHALDVLGERWTLLLIRELLLGPRRFSDLQDGLPGIGTNILSTRLKALEADGIVRRTKLPPPAGSTVYELTELGRRLEPTLTELARWGSRILGPPHPDEHRSFRWLLSGIKATFDPAAAAGVSDVYELRIDGEAFWVSTEDGSIDVGVGPATNPDAIITADLDSLLAVGTGRLSAQDALRDGRLEIEGDLEAARRAGDLLAAPVATTRDAAAGPR